MELQPPAAAPPSPRMYDGGCLPRRCEGGIRARGRGIVQEIGTPHGRPANDTATLLDALAHAPVAVGVINADLVLAAANDALRRLLALPDGTTPGGHKLRPAIGAAGVAALAPAVAAVLAGRSQHETAEWLQPAMAGTVCRTAIIYPIAAEGLAGITLTTRPADDPDDERDAQHRLAASEARYRTLSDNLPDMAWVVLPDGRAEYANRQALMYFGMALSEDGLRSYVHRVHRDDLRRFRVARRETLRGREPGPLELRLRRADGAYRWHLVKSLLLPGRPDARLIIATDIHDRKLAEEHIARSEERYRVLTDTLPGIVTLVDAEMHTRLANRRTLEYYGVTFEELQATPHRDRVHPDDIGPVFDTNGDARQTDAPSRTELRLRRADGEYRWHVMEGQPIPGQPDLRLFIGTDIHDRKLAEARIAESEERYRTLAENMPDAVLVARADGGYDYANEKARALYGGPAESLSATSVRGHRHPDDQEMTADFAPTLWDQGKPLSTEMRIRQPDGSYRWMAVTASPIGGEGPQRRVISVVTDIHDRRMGEERKAGEMQLLRDVSDSLDIFLGLMTPDGVLIEANRTALAAGGIDPADVLGKPFAETYWWDYDPAIQAQIRDAVARAAAGETVEYDTQIRVGTAQFTAIQFRLAPLFDHEGRVRYLVPSGIDIQARVDAATRLAELFAAEAQSKALVETMIGNAPVGFAFLDHDLRHLLVNPALAAINSAPVEYHIGRPVAETSSWLPPEAFAAMRHVTESGEPSTDLMVSVEVPGRPGTISHLLCNYYPVRVGGDVAGVGVLLRDITDRVEAERLLQELLTRQAESGALLETLLSNSPVGFAFVDRDLCFRLVNDAMAEMNGLPAAEHIGRTTREVVPGVPEEDHAMIAAVVATGEPQTNVQVDGETAAQPGVRRHWIENWYPVRVGGEIAGVGIFALEVTARVRGEEALRLSEERYRTLVNALPQKVWTAGADGSLGFYNERYLEYLGAEPGPAETWIHGAGIHPDDQEQVSRRWLESIATGVSYEAEYRLRRYDGQYHWHIARALPLHGPRGEVLGWFGASTDIHEQRLARERQELLSRISLELNRSLDLQETLERVSSAALPSLGDFCFVDLLEGDTIRRVAAAHRDAAKAEAVKTLLGYPPELAAEAHSTARVLRTGEEEVAVWARTNGWRGHARSDEHADALEALQPGAYMALPLRIPGRVVGVITFVQSGPGTSFAEETIDLAREVAERAASAVANAQLFAQEQTALDALRRTEEEQRILIDTIPQLVFVADASGTPTFYNRGWAEYAGQEDPRIFDLVDPEDEERVRTMWRTSVAHHEAWEQEFRLRGADGTYRWFLARTLPLRDAAGGVRGWLGTATNIDIQKEAQAALERTAELKDEFLGMVSHELRTPLTMIGGHANSLLRRAGDVDEDTRRESLQDIAVQSDRLQKLVENMLALSIVESKNEVLTEPMLVQRVIPRTIAGHQERFPGRPIVADIPGDLAVVEAQPTYFEQVLTNLLSNAEKYSPANKEIEVVAGNEDGMVAVRVLDRGSGITAEEAAEIFKPFVRLDRTARSASGAGLGLAVCGRLVEAMGGTIWCAPREGGGAEFGFALPAEVD